MLPATAAASASSTRHETCPISDPQMPLRRSTREMTRSPIWEPIPNPMVHGRSQTAQLVSATINASPITAWTGCVAIVHAPDRARNATWVAPKDSVQQAQRPPILMEIASVTAAAAKAPATGIARACSPRPERYAVRLNARRINPAARVAENPQCDGAGNCATSKLPCNFVNCVISGSNAICMGGCRAHADCITGSACLRTNAHTSGENLGACLDPQKVAAFVGADLQSAINSAADQTYLKLSGTFSGNFTIAGKQLGLIADGSASLVAANADQPVLTISNSTDAVVQGLALSGANGTAKPSSLQCTTSTLQVIESSVSGGSGLGIKSAGCVFTARRSQVSANGGGGLELSNGSASIVNTIIASNGPGTTGGVTLTNASPMLFMSNTVHANQSTSGSAGVACSNQNDVLFNSILWGDTGGAETNCTFVNCDVQGSGGGSLGNLDVDPQLTGNPLAPPSGSAVINAGSRSRVGVSTIDLTNGPRVKGIQIDMGAIEVE